MEKGCACKGGDLTLGPWGSDMANNEWSYRPFNGSIKQIIVRYGEVIDSIMFNGGSDGDYSPKFGGNGGDQTVKIDIDFPKEYLTGISGTYGQFPTVRDNILSLTFHTNRNDYGRFGRNNGQPFSTDANGGVITGFHGRWEQFLGSIGVYIMPASSLSTEARKEKLSEICTLNSGVPPFLLPPRSAAAIGGSGGRDWDDGVFAAVKGIHVRVRMYTVCAVQFSYRKSDGSDFLSPFHGGFLSPFGGFCEDTHKKTISFSEDGEYLIGVEGFYGPVEGISDYNVIKSLSFITNKAKYGPLGAEIGTFFTSMNSGDSKREVVGFHGRSGAYLDAIGTHTEYF